MTSKVNDTHIGTLLLQLCIVYHSQTRTSKEELEKKSIILTQSAMDTHIHTHTQTHAHTHARAQTHTHARAQTHTHAHTHTHTEFVC